VPLDRVSWFVSILCIRPTEKAKERQEYQYPSGIVPEMYSRTGGSLPSEESSSGQPNRIAWPLGLVEFGLGL